MPASKQKNQSIASKLAESRRPHHGDSILNDSNLRGMHQYRAYTMMQDVKWLQERNVAFEPFLEIGAGSIQRSAALANEVGVEGVATDISEKSLQDAPFVLELLEYNHEPMLVGCDAHHLPFLTNTFQFVFAYQALHHFSNPAPVVKECYRVLGRGGHFFFNEEPMDSLFRRVLRGKRELSDPLTTLQKIAYRFRLERVFWDDGAKERSLGMTEARFDLSLWRKTLKPFSIVDIEVNSKLRIRSNLQTPRFNSSLSGFVGGNVKGLCVKTDGEAAAGNFRESLMCLDCNQATLSQIEDGMRCQTCQRLYPIVDGVIRILPAQLEQAIYSTDASTNDYNI